MNSELGRIEERLLEFLTSRCKEGDQVSFNISEALDQLKVSRRELDEALLGLESKGLVKIIRASPSKRLIEEIGKRLAELDYSLLAGELSHEEYLKKREEVTGILPLIPKELEEFTPLPPATIADVIEGLRNSCSHLKSLSEYKEELKPSTFEELRNTYEETLKGSASLLRRYANILPSFAERMKEEIERIQSELEALAVDEKIRGVDLSVVKSEKSRKLDEAREKLRRIVKAFCFIPLKEAEAKALPAEEVERLRDEVEKLRLDLKVLNAKILVEGPTDPLIRRRSVIEDRIRALESLLENARVAEAEKGGLENPIESTTRELEELKRLKLVGEDVYELATEALDTLRKSCEKITVLLGDSSK